VSVLEKEIKKWGNSIVIVIHPLELKHAGLKVGDKIDLTTKKNKIVINKMKEVK